MFKRVLSIVAVVYLFSSPLTVFSQSAPFPDDGGGPPCDGPFGPVCPIDGGLSFLIAAGVAYGGKKSYDLQQKKK